jgi:hypothetical protein
MLYPFPNHILITFFSQLLSMYVDWLNPDMWAVLNPE